ncbi:Cof subfamily protein (haloacid dehalogenase superfamily) [Enterococcus sp. PF1-24]|uniref:Cof-type HAD-IIB family hydrolase n=1 Tax=unclassified Enterococcus TaxID=2608891 RepID=UPI002473B259|nr:MULTISPECIES: Cof-type HAD-IIB family hydrolase [unclassified Enterococcus]MDH6363779.1 Cof subfamily protein (haloacid dehalogenase superfamily) [Enterococcus sp. PFB1-1]MDH6400735.1 Cof subfamily protein (haloacid dehalogenase superfamily) [Enterococcus sp. PF1-24]
MERKLFAFDIDGTLLNSQKQPLASTKRALQKLREKGHLVTIATGRNRQMSSQVLRELAFDNYVVCNGAAAFLDHKQIYSNGLAKPEVQRMVGEMQNREIDTVLIGVDEAVRCSSYDLEKMQAIVTSFKTDLPKYQKDYSTINDIYQGFAFYDQSLDQTVENLFPDFRFIRWHEEAVDVIPKKGSKAASLLFMAEQLGINQKDIIAFGDGENDIEMLTTAGIGVAMGNAEASVQKIADVVTATNDDDGIWKALQVLEAL